MLKSSPALRDNKIVTLEVFIGSKLVPATSHSILILSPVFQMISSSACDIILNGPAFDVVVKVTESVED